MATSGSKSVKVTDWNTLYFSWQEKSQSVENNSTTISWRMYHTATSDGYIASGVQKSWSVTVNGTTYSGKNSVGIDNNTTRTLAEGTTTITHNADGTKSFSYSFTQEYEITFNGWIGDVSGSGTGVLDTIARASQPSCITWPEHTQNVGSFGDTISIHMNRAASTFTHTVRYQFGSKSGTIATGVTTGTTWTIPKSLMSLIPNSLSGSGTIYADTYNGSTLVGTKYCGFTATVPTTADCYPKCSITLEDVSGWDETYGSPVQGLSSINVKVNTTLAYSSPITAYTITANGSKYTTAEATTGLLKNAGDSPVTATVKDQRGRSASASYTMKVQAYAPPSVTELAVHRCDANGTENEQGEYVRVTFSASITSLSNKNTAAYTLRYKKSTATTYTEQALSDLANVYTVSEKSYVFAADSSSSYDVEVEAADRHSTSVRASSASTAFTLMNWGDDGTSMAVGKVAEKEHTLEVALDLDVSGTLIQSGNRYAFSSPGVAASAGFVMMAQITITDLNADTPMTFVFSRRQEIAPMTVHVRFKNSSSLEATVESITYEGANYQAYLSSQDNTTWGLYVLKGSNWDTITLQDWWTSKTMESRVAVTFPGILVDTVPTPYYRATPARLESLLDYIYPVGSIYLSYSHNNPAVMFGGTWVRIEDRFLWATTAAGTIGLTGGAKTHTLTTAEMPVHHHGAVYSGVVDSGYEKTLPWLTTAKLGTGDKLGYGTVTTGGGQAHNNMPPYIQISAWRRTA